jgi:hypothetical protein
VTYDPQEQSDILATFNQMLREVVADGGRKRAAGLKPSWKVDPGHEAAFWRHVDRWGRGELVDADSGVHPLVHAAFRALAIAYQETERPLPREFLDQPRIKAQIAEAKERARQHDRPEYC